MNIIFKILKYLRENTNLVKNIIIVILIVATIISSIIASAAKSSHAKEELTNTSLNSTITELQKEVNSLKITVRDYEQIIKDKDARINALESEIQDVKETSKKLAEAKSNTFKADGNYDQAREVWNYLRDLGLNEYVCAGILGNIMAEVGGQTLDISRWPIYSKNGYYGICQWAGNRKTRLLNDFGTTLDDQIRFLSVELFEVIPKENSFYSMQDEKEAALYFAKYYERCGSGSYNVRQTNATKALQYFTK